MNVRQRVLVPLDHQEPDRPPRDLGSTTATGIHIAFQGQPMFSKGMYCDHVR